MRTAPFDVLLPGLIPILGVNDYPPGRYVRDAMSALPEPGPDVSPQTVEIDARPRWEALQRHVRR